MLGGVDVRADAGRMRGWDMTRDDEALSPDRAAALLRQQEELQAQARAVLADLRLMDAVAQVGMPVHIGSSVLGLMVWRDIDVTVVSPGLSAARAFQIMQPVVTHPRVAQARYVNETRPLNDTKPPHDERYYFAAFYRAEPTTDWKIDVSFWTSAAPRHEPAYMEATSHKLTDETRLAILWIKDIWHRLPAYRTEVVSMDIYDAVLDHGVHTPAEFDAYLRERGKPPRRTSHWA